MVAWPSQLKIERQNYRERPANNILRTGMGQGPDKIRRKSTSNPRPVNFTVFATLTEANTLRTFYETDTLGGVIQFDFTSLLTGVTHKARFLEEPEFVANETMWNISVSLELLA